MRFPTWRELTRHHCSARTIRQDGVTQNNPYFEQFARRRYNCSPLDDRSRFRFIFLKEVLQQDGNSTLVRNGRFVWCSNLRYEGMGECGQRQISFTVDKGKKRFQVSEDNVLCLPSKTYISNNKFFKRKEKTFVGFSSPFTYDRTIAAMSKYAQEDIKPQIEKDNPFRPGALVGPRLGYFYPLLSQDRIHLQQAGPGTVPQFKTDIDFDSPHPCGIILGKSFHNDKEYGRAFYRVRFGDTTYERVHPVELEIINEV